MVDFVLNYEDILFMRRGEDCFYVRYKGANKTEFCIPFSSLLEWDKSMEFYDHCKKLEESQGEVLYPEKTNYYKFIRKDDGTDEKVYFNKYDLVYSLPDDYIKLSYPILILFIVFVVTVLMGALTSLFVCKKIIKLN